MTSAKKWTHPIINFSLIFVVHQTNRMKFVNPWLLIPMPWKKNIELGLYMNPFYSNITVHILCTIFYTFPKALTRRICSTIKSLFSWWSFPLFLCPKCVIQWGYCKEKLDASTSLNNTRILHPCEMAFGIPRNFFQGIPGNKGVDFHGKFGLGIPRNS